MEITRQLRKDKLTKKGFAPIQITICWAGHRVRVFSGEKCRPEHWDDESSRVKSVKGSYYAQINPKLDAIQNAAELAQDAAEQQRRRLGETELLAAVAAITKPELAAAVAPVPKMPKTMIGTPEVPGWYDDWVAEQQAKVSKRTGKATARLTIRTYRATQARLRAFEQHRGGQPLRFEEMNLVDFYGPFREYCLQHLGQKLNTFGKYITHLSTFLKWCDEDMELPVHRKYRKFAAPNRYVGVDALTEDELRRIAALDFSSPALQAQLYALYESRSYFPRDAPEVQHHFQTVELARDKFLQCCYTGLSIQDADAVGPGDVRGELLVWERGKSSNVCHIPYYDDDLFKPVALSAKYAGRSAQLVPYCPRVNQHLKTVAQLAGFTRFALSTKIGRKTFVTIKLFQGVPQRVIMMATGHTTEQSFNRYVGVDALKVVEQFQRHAPSLRRA